jgi:hypothetical protein
MLAALYATTGCAGTLKQKNFFPSIPYNANDFKSKNSRIGFIAPGSSYGLEQDKWILLKVLYETLKRKKEIKVVSPNECMSLINKAGLAEPYVEMIKNHLIGGILEKQSLQKIGTAIGVDYFLHLRLTSFTQTANTRFSVFSLRLINSQQAKMRASIQIWQVRDGSIVWESQVESIISIEALLAKPVSFEKIATAISQQFVFELP